MYVAITLYFSSLLHFQNQKEISITTSHCYQYQEDTQKMFEQNEILHVSSRQAVVGKCQIIKFYKESQILDLSQWWDLSDTDKNLYF